MAPPAMLIVADLIIRFYSKNSIQCIDDFEEKLKFLNDTSIY